MRVIIKEPNNLPVEKFVQDDLKVWQKIVGGYIEVVNFTDTILIVCNEEGKIKNLEPNFSWFGCDIIMGNVCFVGEGGEEFRSLTEDEVNYIMNYFE